MTHTYEDEQVAMDGVYPSAKPNTMAHNTREDRELLRLASLVGTDAKNPEEKLLAYVHHQLQKARQDWLREEIGRLEGMKINDFGFIDVKLNGITHKVKAESDRHIFYNQAIQTIIDHYQAELDQDNKQ